MSRQSTLDRTSHVDRLAGLAYWLDQVFRVPGTKWRFGLEAVLGLIPGIGDGVGAILGAYGLWVAYRVGAPAAVQVRMLLNLALDALGGSVPVVGDLFDMAFKAHVKNRSLIERWAASPTETERTSRLTVVVVFVGLVAIVVVAATLPLLAARLVASWLAGAMP